MAYIKYKFLYESNIVCLCFVFTEKIGDWDPMMEDYFSARNSYKIDVDDAGVATVGYSMYQCFTMY